MVELRRLVPSSGARIFVKWEPANPTGSMKDRMAVEVIRSAAADGRLKPGGTVVEYTAGTSPERWLVPASHDLSGLTEPGSPGLA